MPMPRGHQRAEVPLTPFREAFARCDKSFRQIGRETGKCDTYIARLLTDRGQTITKTLKSGERRRYRAHLNSTSYEMAMLLCEALDLDPVEVGL